MTGLWIALIGAVVPIFVGTTSVVVIQHTEGNYDVPIEQKESAYELKTKILTAIEQSK